MHNFHLFKSNRSQQGSVLIMALLILLVMSIVVMGMAADTDLDLKISRNLEIKNQAFNNAETGIELTTAVLRHVIVNRHWEKNDDPLTLNFGGYVLEIPENIYVYGGIVTLKQNGVISEVTVSSESYSEKDARWFMLESKGFSCNSTKIVSIVIKEKDVSMGLNAPLSLYNNNPSLTIKGNTWVSGKNHQLPENFDCNPVDCTNVLNVDRGKAKYSIYGLEVEDLDAEGNVYNQIDGGVDKIESGPMELDIERWMQKFDDFKSIAEKNDRVFATMPDTLGTRDAPEVTVLNGVDINNERGSGILILKGGSRITGNAHFEGLVIYVVREGDDSLFSGGANSLFGGMIIFGEASDVELEDESKDNIELARNPTIIYSTQALASAMGSLQNNFPIKRLSWRSE